MASREAMIDTIYRAYDARGKGDIEGLMVAFHTNAVFELKGEKDVLEVAGAVQGHSNVRAALTGFIETFEFMSRDIVDAIVEGNRAAVHSRLKVRFVPKDTRQVLRTRSTFVTRTHGSVIHNYVDVAGVIFSRNDRHVCEWHV